MTIRTIITVALHERAILITNGRPEKALRPGRHVVWSLKPIEVVRYDTRAIVVDLPIEHQALLERDEVRVVDIARDERGLIRRRGRPVGWLQPGLRTVWNVERVEKRGHDGERLELPAIEVEVIDVGGVGTAVLADDVKAVVANGEYAEVTVPVGAVGLRMVDGALDGEVGPGRHAAWTVAKKVLWTVIDLRERQIAVTGQDVMTKDKVTLRLNVTATVKVADARRLAMVARDADAAVYLAVQLALRDAVAVRTLDEILADRDVLVRDGGAQLKARAQVLGLELLELGVKDLVLPGEMRTLLNRVIEAQKEAEANVILRREETAATRSLAQTAKVLQENPLLIRLKELEAYKELAAKVGTVNVVLGADAMTKLELKT
jgi:regulator of protease activity HflC (stomatin/prohibitin superfamily)